MITFILLCNRGFGIGPSTMFISLLLFVEKLIKLIGFPSNWLKVKELIS